MKDPEEKALAVTLGRRLEEIRKGKGLSREKVAKATGLTLDTIFKIEKGKRSPRAVTLMRICVALETTPGAVLDGIEWEETP